MTQPPIFDALQQNTVFSCSNLFTLVVSTEQLIHVQVSLIIDKNDIGSHFNHPKFKMAADLVKT